jgi:hypothetical protein
MNKKPETVREALIQLMADMGSEALDRPADAVLVACKAGQHINCGQRGVIAMAPLLGHFAVQKGCDLVRQNAPEVADLPDQAVILLCAESMLDKMERDDDANSH